MYDADNILTSSQKAVIFLSEKPRDNITYAFMRDWTVSGPLAGSDTWLAAMFAGTDLDTINDRVFGGEFELRGDGEPIPHYVFTPTGHNVDLIGVMWMAGRRQPLTICPQKLFMYQFFKSNRFSGLSQMIYGESIDTKKWYDCTLL